MRKLTAIFSAIVLCAVGLVAQPMVTNLSISNIDVNSADLSAEATSAGTISEKGFVWSLEPNYSPSLLDNDGAVSFIPPFSMAEFDTSLMGLDAETTYFVKAYATDGNGTSYSGMMSFATKQAVIPNMQCTISEPISAFGNGGSIILDTAATYASIDLAVDMMDNAYIAGGYEGMDGLFNTVYGVQITSVDADGNLRMSWGNNGRMIYPANPSPDFYYNKISVVTDGDNNVYASTSYSDNNTFTNHLVFMKFDQNGVPDVNFGTNGISSFQFPIDIVVNDIKLIGNEIVFAATAGDGDMAVLGKLDSAGVFDPNFPQSSANDVVSVNTDINYNVESYLEIYIGEIDNTIYALRTSEVMDTGGNFLKEVTHVDKYDFFGNPVTSFGTGGTLEVFPSVLGLSNRPVFAFDGKSLTVGNAVYASPTTGIIAQFNSMGQVDVGFGTNGVVDDNSILDFNGYGSMEFGNDGFLYVQTSSNGLTASENAIRRLDLTGTVDVAYTYTLLENAIGSFTNEPGGVASYSDGSLAALNYYNDPIGSTGSSLYVDLYRICTDGSMGVEEDLGFKPSAYIGIRDLTHDYISIGWAPGDGDGRVVFITEAGAEPYKPSLNESFTQSVNQALNSYTSGLSALYGNSSLVYNGQSNYVSVQDLSELTNYTISVYEYKQTDKGLEYYLKATTGNPRMFMTLREMEPVSLMNYDLDVSESSIFIDWIDGNYPEGTVAYEVALTLDPQGNNPVFPYDGADIGMMSEFAFGGLLANTDYYVWIRTTEMMSVSEWSILGPIRTLMEEPDPVWFFYSSPLAENAIELRSSSSAESCVILAFEVLPAIEPQIMDGTYYYGANSDFTLAAEPFGPGKGKLVYNGSFDEFLNLNLAVDGLMTETGYYFYIVPYNGTEAEYNINYGMGELTAASTLAPEPMTATDFNLDRLPNGNYELEFNYSSDNAIVVLAQTTSPIGQAVDGLGYEPLDIVYADAFFAGEVNGTVVYKTDRTIDNGMVTAELTSLVVGSSYNVTIYSYNGDYVNLLPDPLTFNTTGSQNYDSGLTNFFIPVGPEPSPVAADVQNRGIYSIALDWSADAAAATEMADNYLVIANKAELPGAFLAGFPEDGEEYLNGMSMPATFAYGSYVESDFGTYSVVYNGPGTSTTVNGLDPDQAYIFYVVPYTGGNMPMTQNYAETAAGTLGATFAETPAMVSNLMASASGQHTIDVTWDNPTNETVIIIRNNTDFDCSPSMGDKLQVGVAIPSCPGEVIYVGTGASFEDTGLMTDTEYFYDVYVRAGTDQGGYNTYNYSMAAEVSENTDAAPTATSLTIKSIPATVTSKVDFSATVALRDQNGAGFVAAAATTVILKYDGNSVGTGVMAHGDSLVTITANIDAGAANGVTVTASAAGLTDGTATVNIILGDPSQVTNVGIAVNRRDLNVSWTLPSDATGVLVYAKKNSTTDNADPADGTTYTASAFNDGNTATQLVYSGTGTSMSLTNLARYKRYYFAIYTYNGSGSSINYNTDEVIRSARTRAKEGETIIPDAVYSGESFNVTEIFPNPVSENIVFELQNEETDNIFTIQLVDATGSVVANFHNGITLPIASNRMDLPVPAELSNGVYYLTVTSANHTMTKAVRVAK